mmetsp:Transcript_25167/g.28221  ORF Transcript_25167/g.28221 Transcript_25167/m.28221 type:complete len:226 (+) Transcript_25167:1309-1986(+)
MEEIHLVPPVVAVTRETMTTMVENWLPVMEKLYSNLHGEVSQSEVIILDKMVVKIWLTILAARRNLNLTTMMTWKWNPIPKTKKEPLGRNQCCHLHPHLPKLVVSRTCGNNQQEMKRQYLLQKDCTKSWRPVHHRWNKEDKVVSSNPTFVTWFQVRLLQELQRLYLKEQKVYYLRQWRQWVMNPHLPVRNEDTTMRTMKKKNLIRTLNSKILCNSMIAMIRCDNI